MIVADTCLITHLFNKTEKTEQAQRIFDKDSEWIVPKIWQNEYANVLSKFARKSKKSVKDVLEHFEFTRKSFHSCEVDVDIQKALRLSLEFHISVYDANFVSLALEQKIFLVTEDEEVLKKCPRIAMSMKEFA